MRKGDPNRLGRSKSLHHEMRSISLEAATRGAILGIQGRVHSLSLRDHKEGRTSPRSLGVPASTLSLKISLCFSPQVPVYAMIRTEMQTGNQFQTSRPAPHFVVESRSWSTINRSARHQESSPAPSQISNSALTKPSKLALSSE